jgi:hypothetical protein
MIAAAQTALALGVTLVAARAILRRRIVYVLGHHGRELAPGVLASVWLVAALLGQRTGSIAGMVWVAAAAMVGIALWARRRFALQRGRRVRWSAIDHAIVAVAGFVLFFTGLWDFNCHEVIVGQLLHGNLPPSALNDPRAPLAYHAIYDLIVAVIMTVLPIEIEPAMGLASVGCVALTVANLRSITRRLFDRPVSAQLGRVLFAFGFGPTFLRFVIDSGASDPLHGSTSQVYLDIILRRPAGMGIAFFTLALALLLPPLYRGRAADPSVAGPNNHPLETERRRTTRALVASLPTFVLLPLMAEETVVLAIAFLAPPVLLRRVPWYLVAALVLATTAGALQSGVMHAVFGRADAMAVPHPRLAWPPTLPTWKAEDHGAGLGSRHALFFVVGELGPVFAGGLVWALAGRAGGRGRALVAIFGTGLMVTLFVQPAGWPKSDLDRFLFYGTPLVFMAAAGLVDWWAARSGSRRRRIGTTGGAIALGAFACVTPLVFPGSTALANLEASFQRHGLGGELRSRLRAVGPHQLVLTTRERARDLLRAGFLVLAPFDTNSVGTLTEGRFDPYVREHADRADWLFLPQNDERVAGRTPEARDGDFVLVRAGRAAAGAPAAGPAVAAGAGS